MDKLLVPEPKRPAPGRWRRLVGVALVVLLGVGVAGELLLRLGPDPDGPRAVIRAGDPGAGALEDLFRTQTSQNLMVYAPDPELGALLAPSREDVVETVDFTYTLATDHAGFPNAEPWPATADVAVLGNSLLVGPGVGMDGQFTSLLEDRLEGRSVMNFGLPGGGTEHLLLTYRRFVQPLQPELVFTTLWVIWDIENSMQFAHWVREGKPDPDYTNYRYTFSQTHRRAPAGTNPRTETPPSRRDGVADFVRRQIGRSRLVRTAYESVQSLRADPGVAVLVRFPNSSDLVLSARYQERIAQGMDRPDTQDMPAIFFTPLEQLRDEVERGGGRFVVVLVPSKEEVYGSDATPAILTAIQEVKAGLESRRLPVLDLYPVFRARGWEQPPFYRADMHLNVLGNEIVADAMAEWITANRVFSARAETVPGR